MLRRLIILLLIVGCDNSTEPEDCAGVTGGTAGLDSCAVCIGGTTNLTACIQDCNGDWGGTAALDDCGVCDGIDGYVAGTCYDCADTPNGYAVVDNCGVCDGIDGYVAGTCYDCAGVPNGLSYLDECGGCDANVNNDCIQDCAGVWGGFSYLDNCNVCDTDKTNDCVPDCAGIWGGDAESRLMGDIDGDGYITGGCCEQASCQNNPEYEIVPPCDGPAGDATMIAFVRSLGCGEWIPEHTDDLPTADNCPLFYWIDIDGNGKIGNLWDTACPGGYYTGTAGPNMIEGQCCVPDTSDSPCAGKCVGEECCIPE